MSPQRKSLMRQYGVTNERELIKAIREEYARETGEKPSVAVANILLDRLLDAEYHRLESTEERGER